MRKYAFVPLMGSLVMFLTLSVWACDDSSPTGPSDPVAAEIAIEPTQVVLAAIGEQEQLSATVYDDEGEVISDAEVTWASSDEAVATVDEDGLVEAVGAGTATITAESGDATDSIEVTVNLDG